VGTQSVHAEVHADFRIAAWAIGKYDKSYFWSYKPR